MTTNRIKAITVRAPSRIPSYLPTSARPRPKRDLPGFKVGNPLTFRQPNRAVSVIARMTAEKVPTKVHAFEFCPCVHESGYELVSLHTTKAGAWKAMHAHKWAFAVQEREDYLRTGYNLGRMMQSMKGWTLREYEVQP